MIDYGFVVLTSLVSLCGAVQEAHFQSNAAHQGAPEALKRPQIFVLKEELNPELKRCLYDDGEGGECLKHPLLFAVPYCPQMNALHNAALGARKTAVAAALEKGDSSRYIWLHERPYCLMAFQRIANVLHDEQYWEVLADVCTDSENIWQRLAEWKKLLRSSRPKREFFMSAEDRATFASLPDVLTIYRGYEMQRNMPEEKLEVVILFFLRPIG